MVVVAEGRGVSGEGRKNKSKQGGREVRKKEEMEKEEEEGMQEEAGKGRRSRRMKEEVPQKL